MLFVSLAGPAHQPHADGRRRARGAREALRPETVSYVRTIDDLPLGVQILFSFALVNLFLGLFNLLPIPPLDGSALHRALAARSVAAHLVPVPARTGSSCSSCSCSRPGIISDVPRSLRRTTCRLRVLSPGDERAVHLSRRFFGALRPGPPRRRRRRVGGIGARPRRASRCGSASPITTAAMRSASRATCEARARGHALRRRPAVDLGRAAARHRQARRAVSACSAGWWPRSPAPPRATTWPTPWSEKSGFTRRVGLYLRHPELGADRIRLAGGPRKRRAGPPPTTTPSTGPTTSASPTSSSAPSTPPTTTDASQSSRSS